MGDKSYATLHLQQIRSDKKGSAAKNIRAINVCLLGVTMWGRGGGGGWGGGGVRHCGNVSLSVYLCLELCLLR